MKIEELPFIVNGPPCQCGHARIRHISPTRTPALEAFDGPCLDCDCLPTGYMPPEGHDYAAMRRKEFAIEVALTTGSFRRHPPRRPRLKAR